MGVGIQLADVYLELGGRRVLEQIQLQIQPGEHLALLGRSGAGKSSLLNLLLGFEQPSQGAIAIDGEALSIAAGEAERADSTLARLRRSTAWVDPTVQLWNQSAFQNLLFGRDGVSAEELVQALAECDAAELIAALPAGLATPLGESGTRLSGGEGQRLRLARAWLQGEARLVLLDEPFRGLERSRRRQLLQRLRQRFQRATLITVTHDVASALDFDRVAVLEAGRLVECDRPALLKARPDSRFNALLQAERQLLEVGYGDLGWRRLQVVNGRLETEG